MKSQSSIFSFDLLLAAAAATAVLLSSACSKDPTGDDALSGSPLRFEVVDAHGWQTPPLSRADGDTTDAAEYVGVFALQGETPADTLFLDATVADGIESNRSDAEVPQTRATPVEEDTFYDSFGVLASAYTGSWSETSCRPDYMYNVEVTKASGWTTNYLWPGGGREVRFFAYAPYGASGVVLSDKTKAGAPTIRYTVPAAVASQNDLLVAAPAAMDGAGSAAAPLPFGHVLTAVRFVTGDDVLAGKITKITLKGVYGSATLAMGAPAWSDYGKTANFSQSCSVNVDGSADQEITSAKATFMMLPQTLPSGASIEIAYMDDLTSTQRTLTASVAGAEWPMGKTVTYRISTTSITITPELAIEENAEYTGGGDRTSELVWTHEGGYLGSAIRIVSRVTVSRPGDATKTLQVPWKTEFIEDDGAGGYRVIPKPDWISAFSDRGSGTVITSVSIRAQQADTVDLHNEVLAAAASVGGTYDLSTKGGTTPMNTANCYVINAPGTYSLPLVYGNAVKNGEPNIAAYRTDLLTGVLRILTNHLDQSITDPYIYNNANCTPKDAVLVWQDAKDLVTNVALAADGHSLTFEVPQASIKQGNAIVAVRDASNRIMWSWHIWVTDYVPGLEPTVTDRYDPYETQRDKVVTNHSGKQYTFMGVDIGWCDNILVYDARSVKVRYIQPSTGATTIITLTQKSRTVNQGNNPYFGWGRKDPMLGGILDASGSLSDKPYYYHNSTYGFQISTTGKVTIGKAIQTPYIYYNGGTNPYNWCTTLYNNMWYSSYADKNSKTIYDPSPVGYRVPEAAAFTGFTYSGFTVGGASGFGSQFNSPYASEADITDRMGWEFYCNKMNGAGKYDPAGGTIFFPLTGGRSFSREGALAGYGTTAIYWASGVETSPRIPKAVRISSSPEVKLGTTFNSGTSCQVRPVRE
ncbi:fimbrillin family protein [Alistipes sp.]|uniref:fimbrillin family protein n=1 Tax=Alistipes sp. TaxID=1872444 RepID=UPI003A85AC59